MTREEVVEMAALLASVAGMRRPKVVWKPRLRRRAWAFPSRWEIHVGPAQAKEWVVVHEVAHLLVHREHGRLRRGASRRGEHHGPAFVDAVMRLASLWYGSHDRYPWECEYAVVQRIRARLAEGGE